VFNFLGLPFGIFGTYMGLYNNNQIDHVRKELYNVINYHNQLVEVVQLQELAISTITADIQELTAVLHLTSPPESGIYYHHINHIDRLDSNTITPQLVLPGENGLFWPTLSDLQELKLHQKQGAHWWTTLANFVGNLVMLFLFVGLLIFLAVRFHRFRQAQLP
jgi:hypothetical protein